MRKGKDPAHDAHRFEDGAPECEAEPVREDTDREPDLAAKRARRENGEGVVGGRARACVCVFRDLKSLTFHEQGVYCTVWACGRACVRACVLHYPHTLVPARLARDTNTPCAAHSQDVVTNLHDSVAHPQGITQHPDHDLNPVRILQIRPAERRLERAWSPLSSLWGCWRAARFQGHEKQAQRHEGSAG